MTIRSLHSVALIPRRLAIAATATLTLIAALTSPLDASAKPKNRPSSTKESAFGETDRPDVGESVAKPVDIGDADTWSAYQQKHRFDCMGPIGPALKTPELVKSTTRDVRIDGYRASEIGSDTDKAAVLGILSTVKGAEAATIWNLREFIAHWKKAKAEAILVGGDIATNEDDTALVLYTLGASGLPVYVIIGNNDSRAQFNRAVERVSKRFPNVINMNLVRFVDGDDYDIVSLPGYYDRKFVASGAVCIYKPDHVTELDKLAALANDPIVFLSHGPPKDATPKGIDVVAEGDHVGDPALNTFIDDNKIPFGIFGHIIEAGGIATDLIGKIIKPGTFAKRLYLNPGAASSQPWMLNTDKDTVGMAATLTIKGAEAKFEPIVIPLRAHDDIDASALEEEIDDMRTWR